MKIQPLLSSSGGNATRFISSEGDDILVDAGDSWKQIAKRTSKDYTPDAIIVSHEHRDHVKGAGIAGRKTGSPVYIIEKCYEAMEAKKEGYFKKCDINFFKPGDQLEFGSLVFDTFSTRHDCVDSVSFKVADKADDVSLGFLTDTGVITPLIKDKLEGCDAYCIEMDYDTQSLQEYDGYDPMLKDRITSPWGHLSNQQAIKYIKENLDLSEISFIIPLHLSPRTNSPQLVKRQLAESFPGHKDLFHLAPLDYFLELK